jgi:hypothetical protein
MADILEQFEQKRKAQVDAEREYLAFRALDKRQFRLQVRPLEDVWDRLPYRMLLRIMERGREGTAITLVYSFMAVFIEGRNLCNVADAIERELCDFIEEFDAERHDKPVDLTAPFISKITLLAAAEMGEPGKPPSSRKPH